MDIFSRPVAAALATLLLLGGCATGNHYRSSLDPRPPSGTVYYETYDFWGPSYYDPYYRYGHGYNHGYPYRHQPPTVIYVPSRPPRHDHRPPEPRPPHDSRPPDRHPPRDPGPVVRDEPRPSLPPRGNEPRPPRSDRPDTDRAPVQRPGPDREDRGGDRGRSGSDRPRNGNRGQRPVGPPPDEDRRRAPASRPRRPPS